MLSSPNPDLVVLPFMVVTSRGRVLTRSQYRARRRSGRPKRMVIERSYPGAPQALGWTVFQRGLRAFEHQGAPLFQSERSARRYIRRLYAIRHAMNEDGLLTCSHL